MNCHDCERLVHAWADGELDPVATADLETHLNDCSPCAARAEAIAALGASVRAAPLYAAAPRGLEGRVRSVLRREAGVAPWKLAIGRWGAIAAAVLLAGFIGWALPHGHNNLEPLAAEVLSAHLRSLMASHLLDVPSSDRHTVKPWFAGKIDFSPEVRDCAGEGFALQGGRLDCVSGRPVAALVYRHDKHVINVFIWPATGDVHLDSHAMKGYHERQWERGGLTYVAVSDASDDALKALQNCLTREPAETHPTGS